MPSEPPAVGIPYSPKTLQRASLALRCSRFCLPLFQAMQVCSVPLGSVVAPQGMNQGYTRRSLTEAAAEWDFKWLIQVGILRREVDGQGITDSFRLTPLGHRLLEQWQGPESFATPTMGDRLYNALNRWLRLTL